MNLRGALASAALLVASCGGGDVPRPDTTGVERAVVEAIEGARSFVERSGGKAPAWGKLALVLDAHDFTTEARRAYAKCEELAPDDPRWPYLASFCMGDDTAAILASLARARDLAPDRTFVRERFAEFLLEAGDAQAALDELDAVEASGGGSASTWLLVARAREAAGDESAARSALDTALALEPTSRPALALASRLAARAGDMAAARDFGERAKALADPPPASDPWRAEVEAAGTSAVHIAIRAGEALRAGDFDAAVDGFRRASEMRPELMTIRVDLAQALVLAGRVSEGRDILEYAIEAYPQETQPKRTLAAVLASMGELERSAELCEEVLAVHPGDAELRVRYEAILRKLGR